MKNKHISRRRFLSYVPVAGVALATYWFHLSSRNPGRWWLTLHEGRLEPEYPATVAGFAANTLRLFNYLFLTQRVWWLPLLFCGGLVILWATRRRVVAGVVLLTLCLNVVLTLGHEYPFGGVRQSFFLLPVIAIPIGAAVQYGWDLARSRLTTSPDVWRWVTVHRKALGAVTFAVFCLGIVGVCYELSESDFLRHRYGRGNGELPVTQEDVSEAVRFLKANVQPGDVILGERQVLLYAQLAAGHPPVPETDGISRITFEGLDLYGCHLDYEFFLDTRERIFESIARLARHVDARGESTIWVVSIGWQRIREPIGNEIDRPPLTEVWLHGGASVYGFSVSAVAEEMARRPSDPV